MCGICGIVHANGAPVELEPVRRMRTRLAHRGPDDVGEFCEGPAGLGFQRLSILDLEGGHQPMRSPDGRFAIVFNGEIFNHPQLRIELEALGTRFRTRSDTETILELFIREGAAAFSRLSGMFAVAVWDRGERRLTLARDPIGIKPVYYSLRGDTLLFSSELRSLIAGAEGWALDPAGILDFLCSGRTHAPRTVLRDVSKLPPATTLEFDASGLRLHTYWRLPRGRARSSGLRESVDTLDRLLTDVDDAPEEPYRRAIKRRVRKAH